MQNNEKTPHSAEVYEVPLHWNPLPGLDARLTPHQSRSRNRMLVLGALFLSALTMAIVLTA